ncbi:MAG: DMT family transporter [Muribaculaceae bacterium]|nr:DMT family transporter [Muribaculaceae bacterium]MDE6522833.1 DMT family transporter [Muribaculaceae bacterium]
MNYALKIKGYSLAALAAAAYGTNPAFAVPLYGDGMNPVSVLLFRYLMGLPILAAIMAIRGKSFSLKKDEIVPTMILGVLMALSSLTLFESYNYMNSGVASTLLFVYPVMVAVMMIMFFHEKFSISTVICLVVMGAGLMMLMKPQGETSLSLFGCLLVMLSALTYALYIVMVNVSKGVKNIPTTKLLFYVLAWGSLVYVIMIACGSDLTVPEKGWGWINLLALAVIPTMISLGFTTRAIQLIGSTPTAILGALEPVSAVILSVVVLGQQITVQDIIGGSLIVVATTIVICAGPVDKAILRMRKMFPKGKQQ